MYEGSCRGQQQWQQQQQVLVYFMRILSYLLKALEGLNVLKHIKPGHGNSLGGVRPAAKVPYDIIDEVEAELDKLYETAIPIDPCELDVASQVVPVVNTKNGKRSVRLCINYKNTINEHLMDEPCSSH